MEGVSEISIQIVEALPTTEPPEYTLMYLMVIHIVAAERGVFIKKESSWVKLKVFPTNVGRPNKLVQLMLESVTDLNAQHRQRMNAPSRQPVQ